MGVVAELDLGIGAVVHVQDEGLAPEGAVDLGKRLAIAEHADVAHVDDHFAGGETALGGLRILRITGIEVARLDTPDRLDVLEALHAAAQFFQLAHRLSLPPSRQ
jgi:hypothetical protein